ncbi:MAG: branched-chain amino acid aminotransferase [Erythrobacter sp.]|jgi:branched-chain amino acid aminotransferase|nr:branched-chain amino acid aminotransferase [Erythrobacter sp.]
MHFAKIDHPSPTPDEARNASIADPGFGTTFTDHMAYIDYGGEKEGWHSARIAPRKDLVLHPAASVLHYGQEIFEGMKAYAHETGGLALFRPRENARRFNASARRMAMPELPEDAFLDAVRRVVLTDAAWMPPMDGGSIYIRPFMFANETFLGVRPARRYQFLVLLSAAGNYFKGGTKPIRIWVSEDYVRAAQGGTGAAKTGGNYAASLVPQAEATAMGCDQVVFLDAIEHRYVEELGGMNLFFVRRDGSVITPPLTGTILPGITRDSLITLLREDGMEVREEPYAVDRWRSEAQDGTLAECFACGTAAVVTPIGTVASTGGEFSIGNAGTGEITQRLRERLIAIQHGREDDRHGWVEQLSE